MVKKRHELLHTFEPSTLIQHPDFSLYSSLENLHPWHSPFNVELPRLKTTVESIDYIESPPNYIAHTQPDPQPLNFQQDSYRLWYQIEGTGILQNITRKTFGTARPGLLGVMERGERHSYLHQRGRFACFQIVFSISPSSASKCYWNSEIEGKTVLEETDRLWFENILYEVISAQKSTHPFPELITCSHLLSMLSLLFDKDLICIEESRFPRNKAKCLVNKAINYINANYHSLHHQNALEQECHVDINYLNILFKKETGSTLYHYLSSVRMEHAKHLLVTSRMNVSDIATRSGYPNANSFSRAFKRLEQCTPLDFRLKNKRYSKSK